MKLKVLVGVKQKSVRLKRQRLFGVRMHIPYATLDPRFAAEISINMESEVTTTRSRSIKFGLQCKRSRKTETLLESHSNKNDQCI